MELVLETAGESHGPGNVVIIDAIMIRRRSRLSATAPATKLSASVGMN